MKRFLILIAAGGLFACAYPQQVIRTGVEGVAVQSFSASQAIDGFTVSGPDTEGYVYLVAHAGSQSGEVLRSRWQGTGFQALSLPQGECLTGFMVSGPDAEGYVYLRALGSDGSTGDIVRSKLAGVAVQSWIADEPITSLRAYGPDDDGCVYLVADTGEEDVAQTAQESLKFALTRVASPCTDAARISYSVASSCKVSIKIFDASGRLIASLVDDEQPAGSYDVMWNASDESGRKVNAGVYFVRMDAGSFSAATKLVVVK